MTIVIGLLPLLAAPDLRGDVWMHQVKMTPWPNFNSKMKLEVYEYLAGGYGCEVKRCGTANIFSM